MPYRPFVSALVLVLALASAGHAGPKTVTARDWIARAEAAVARGELGRALANYLEASKRPGDKPADLADRITKTGIEWLKYELTTRVAALGDNYVEILGVVRGIHALAERSKVDPAVLGLVDVGNAAARGALKAHLASMPPNSTLWSQMGYVIGVYYSIPSFLPAVDEIKTDLDRRMREIRDLNQQLRDRIPPSLPGARLLYEQIVSGLDDKRHDLEPARAALAQVLSLDARVTLAPGTSCQAFTDGVAQIQPKLPRGGRHKVVLAVAAGGTCTSTLSVTAFTKKESHKQTRRESYRVTTPGGTVCTSHNVDSTCIAGPYGRGCVKTTTCTDSLPTSETKYRDVEETITTEKKIKQRTIRIDMSVPYTIEVDGKVTSGTLTESKLDFEDVDDVPEPRWSHTPEAVIADGGSRLVASKLDTYLMLVQREMQDELVKRAAARIGKNDLDGAADDLMTVLATSPYGIPDNLALLAQRSGMPFKPWDQLVNGHRADWPHEDLRYVNTEIAFVEPDDDLLKEQQETDRIQYDKNVKENEEVGRIVDDMLGRSVMGLGIAQWHPPGGDNAYGLDFLYGSQKSNGYHKYWSREFAATLGLHSGFAASLEGLYRIGAGLRNASIGVSVHGVGGVSRRGVASEMDIGLPFAPELGAGAKIVIGPGHARRFELLAEQLWRPTADEDEVKSRTRYELRYVKSDIEGEDDLGVGVRAWCALEKSSSTDLGAPSSTTANRTCTVAAFLSY